MENELTNQDIESIIFFTITFLIFIFLMYVGGLIFGIIYKTIYKENNIKIRRYSAPPSAFNEFDTYDTLKVYKKVNGRWVKKYETNEYFYREEFLIQDIESGKIKL